MVLTQMSCLEGWPIVVEDWDASWNSQACLMELCRGSGKCQGEAHVKTEPEGAGLEAGDSAQTARLVPAGN